MRNILDMRGISPNRIFLVEWFYFPSQASWEPETNLDKSLIIEFEVYLKC